MRRIARLQQRPLAGCAPVMPAAAGPRAAAGSPRHMHLCRPQQQQQPQHAGPLAKTACVRAITGSTASSSNSRLFSTSSSRRWTKTEGATTTTDVTDEEKAIFARAEAHFDAKEAAEAAAAAAAEADGDGPADGPQLVLPGRYATAPRPDKIADVGYVPAETGEGLETVGGLQDWWEDDAHWDPAVAFRGFGPARRVTDAAVLEVLAQRAVLEAVAVQQQQQQTQQTSSDSVRLTDAWRRGGPAALDAALGLQVEVDAAGRVVRVQGDVAGVVAGLAPQAEAEAEAAADEKREDDDVPVPSADEARALLASAKNDSWKAVSLDADPALKFAVTKRLLQLTGHLLADAHVATAATAGALLAVLVRPPKAAKLADELLAAEGPASELAGLPNVAVYGRRVTPIDKHKMAGRWKVMVQELERRGLPVTGMGGHAKAVEKKWATR